MDILKGREAGITFIVLAGRHQVTPQRISQIYGQVMRRGGVRWLRRVKREGESYLIPHHNPQP